VEFAKVVKCFPEYYRVIGFDYDSKSEIIKPSTNEEEFVSKSDVIADRLQITSKINFGNKGVKDWEK
jgi:hypothetical protein